MSKKMKRREILKGSAAMSLGVLAGENVCGAVDENPFPPKKIITKSPTRYSPLTYLKKVAEKKPQLSFSASRRSDAEEWQKKLRVKLWELLGEQHKPSTNAPKGRLLETERLEDYTCEKWELDIYTCFKSFLCSFIIIMNDRMS